MRLFVSFSILMTVSCAGSVVQNPENTQLKRESATTFPQYCGISSLRSQLSHLKESGFEEYILPDLGFAFRTMTKDWVIRHSHKRNPGDDDTKFILFHKTTDASISVRSGRTTDGYKALAEIKQTELSAYQDSDNSVVASEISESHDGHRVEFYVRAVRDDGVDMLGRFVIVKVADGDDLYVMFFMASPEKHFASMNRELEYLIGSLRLAM